MRCLLNVVLMVSVLAIRPAVAEQRYRYVRVPASALSAEVVATTGFIRDHVTDEDFAFGYLPVEARLDALGAKVDELDAWAWASGEYDPKTLLRREARDGGAAGPYEEYHTYDTLTSELKDLAARFGHLASLHTAGKTVQGRELWYLRITGPGLRDPHKPKLLYVSSMHGDEVTGKEMLVYLVRELLAKYGTDARLTALLDNAELFVMPSMNPDGTEKRQRWNAKGTDLNRDFPEMHEAGFSTQGRQPETVHLMELQRQHHFVGSMNFHGGSLCVNIPWDHKANPAHDRFGDDAVMVRLATEYSKNNAAMWKVNGGSFVNGITYGFEWYEVLGGMQDWSIAFRQATHATLEISGVKWPAASQLPRFWSENRESLLRYLEVSLDGIHLKVTDGEGNPVNALDVDVDTARRTMRFDGVVHRATVPGTQRVTLRAPGYRTKTIVVEAEPFRGAYRGVALERETRRVP